MMRYLCSWRFLVFLLISWIVYNSIFIPCFFIYTKGEFSLNEFKAGFTYVYLLGGRYPGSPGILYAMFLRPAYHMGIFWFIALLTYLFLVNGIPTYLWCRRQNAATACLLALAGAIGGPCILYLYADHNSDFINWLLSLGSTIAFYAILAVANVFRKKFLPALTLPPALEWRHNNILPSLGFIWRWLLKIFKKSASASDS